MLRLMQISCCAALLAIVSSVLAWANEPKMSFPPNYVQPVADMPVTPFRCDGATCRADCEEFGDQTLCRVYCVATGAYVRNCFIGVSCPRPC